MVGCLFLVKIFWEKCLPDVHRDVCRPVSAGCLMVLSDKCLQGSFKNKCEYVCRELFARCLQIFTDQCQMDVWRCFHTNVCKDVHKEMFARCLQRNVCTDVCLMFEYVFQMVENVCRCLQTNIFQMFEEVYREMFADVCRQMFARCLRANSQSPPLSSLLLLLLIEQIS